jgi:hypothetical protein
MRSRLALVLAVMPFAALAQHRPAAQALTCGQAQALVAAEGAVVMSTGPYTYSRFVSSVAACLRGQTTEPAWTGTTDDPQCFVGYRCRDTDLEFGR